MGSVSRIGLVIAPLLLIVGPAWAEPFPDVPVGHRAAASVARLTELGILTTETGEFRGDEAITRDEAAHLAALINAFAALRYVRQDTETSLNAFIRDRGVGVFGEMPDVPVGTDDPMYAVYVYLAISNPDRAEPLLDTVEGLPRYTVARVLCRVLDRLEEAAASDLVSLVPGEDEPTDWDFGPEEPSMPPAEMDRHIN